MLRGMATVAMKRPRSDSNGQPTDQPLPHVSARPAPLGVLGWLMVAASTSAPVWPDPLALAAVPLALTGTGLAAWQAGRR